MAVAPVALAFHSRGLGRYSSQGLDAKKVWTHASRGTSSQSSLTTHHLSAPKAGTLYSVQYCGSLSILR